MLDVLIVGAGPAGAVAGAILARAGVRVRLVDRAAFPRDKLCGDTINPGALAILRRLGLAGDIEQRGLPVNGMLVTGEGGVAIEGRYPRGLCGRAIVRRELDNVLLQRAVAAGCDFEDAVTVRHARVDDRHGRPTVVGVAVSANGSERAVPATLTIAADGRHSTLAFGLGLARHPARPRRWAIGGYFTGVGLVSGWCQSRARVVPGWCQSGVNVVPDSRCTFGSRGTFGEMHVRRNCYIGVAPLPGGLTNACLVKPSGPSDADLRDPAALLARALARDPLLRDRFAGARLVAPPVVLGPLAVDVRDTPIDGLLLAGDAAGFIDPITGDGLRFAIRGGELAAAAALQALEHGWTGVHARLAAARRGAFGAKWRFNRALRAIVASPRAVNAAAAGARIAPGIMRAIIARAGDCELTGGTLG
jgi:flavin-dependent dehydrogenase